MSPYTDETLKDFMQKYNLKTMKNTNISEYGCSTLGEQKKPLRCWHIVVTVILTTILVDLIISFLTIPR